MIKEWCKNKLEVFDLPVQRSGCFSLAVSRARRAFQCAGDDLMKECAEQGAF